MKVKRYKKEELKQVVWWARLLGRTSIVLTFLSLFLLLVHPVFFGYFLLVGLISSIVSLVCEAFGINQLEMRYRDERNKE